MPPYLAIYQKGLLMPPNQIENLLKGILRQYQSSFSDKIYGEENDDYDSLMRVFGITPSLKRENRQYWNGTRNVLVTSGDRSFKG
ncbi:MAG UNVERIFIED_CONTAM: hypothetical protein LVT10_25190 [Anaerolineae bacterium]